MAINDIATDGVSRISAFWVSTVRTITPVIAAYLISMLAGIGINAPVGTETGLASLVFLVLTGLWYVIARLLEEQGNKRGIKWVANIGGLMLGIPKPPVYAKKDKTPAL